MMFLACRKLKEMDCLRADSSSVPKICFDVSVCLRLAAKEEKKGWYASKVDVPWRKTGPRTTGCSLSLLRTESCLYVQAVT